MADNGDVPTPSPTWAGPLDEQRRPHGVGVMSYPPRKDGGEGEGEEEQEPKPGDSYSGAMQHGQRHGHGTYTWGANGARYEGEYGANRRHGNGTMRFPDGSRYEGSFVADALEGEGCYTYTNGDVYSGSYASGKKHGSGQLFFKAHGCVFIGVFSEGAFIEGRWVHRDGTTYSGSFEASVPAEGTYAFTNGLVQAGRYDRQRGWVAVASG